MLPSNDKLLLFGLETERLIFRKVEPSDFDVWLKFCEEKDALKYIFSKENQALKAQKKCEIWFEKVFHRYENNLGGMNALIEKSTGHLVGQCGLLIQTIDEVQELEIGYSLLENFRGKGFAFEAAIACKIAAQKGFFSNSLISVIVPENNSSIKVALKNGMHLSKSTIQNGDEVNIYRVQI